MLSESCTCHFNHFACLCLAAAAAGDDTEVEPKGWPSAVVSAFAEDPQLMLLLLRDAADPGFPSFPVLRLDTHLKLHGGKLLPDCFINQGVSHRDRDRL
jgi:hypothetical protein